MIGDCRNWTVQEFRRWAIEAAASFALDGPISNLNRSFARRLRQHDPALADLYVKLAEANEAIRAHLSARIDR